MLQRLFRRVVLLEPGEGRPFLWSAAYFFLLLTSYYLLRPLREAMGIAKGAEKLPWLMTGTLLVMLAVNPLFAALVSRLPRRRFIPWAYRAFGLTLLCFGVLFLKLPLHGGPALGYAFYIWLSVFNLFVVSVFWALMADVWTEAQGRRLFGMIAVGGTLGAMAGSALTEVLSRTLGLQAGWLLLLSVLLLEGAVQCVRALANHFELGDVAGAAREPGPGLWTGLKLMGQSRYLQLICGYMLLFTVTSTFLYLQQGDIVARTFKGQAARTAAFARVDFWVNGLSLVGQLFFTGRLLKRTGVGLALVLLPSLTLLGFGALALWPTFAVLSVVMVARRGLHYAVDRPTRELLYIPLGPEEKYKTKSFIDTFVYRAGDLLGVWAPSLLAGLGVALAGLGLSGLWATTAGFLGRQRARLN